MKNKFLLLLSAVLCFGFYSCENNEEEGNGSTSQTNKAVGTWYCSRMVTSDGQIQDPKMALTLKSDGTGTAQSEVIQTGSIQFKWSISGKTITIKEEGESSTKTFSLVELTNSALVISGHFDEGMDGVCYFTRVSRGNPQGYNESLLYGHWCSTHLLFNGEEVSNVMCFDFNRDHTGLMSDDGVTEHNGFTWSMSGNTITARVRNGEDGDSVNVYLHLINLTATTFSMTAEAVLDGEPLTISGTWGKSN